MWRQLGPLLFFVASWGVQASGPELLSALSGRIRSLPENRGTLIQSYTDHSQSYIYDQALAIMTFVHAKKFAEARDLLRGLSSLQLPDGSLYFSYYLDGKAPYPEEGDRRYNGALAWVAMAATHYQRDSQSREFVNFNQKILQRLADQMKELEIEGKKVKAVVFNPTDLNFTHWKENETVALEHNLDAYSAFLHFSRLNKDQKWFQLAQEVRAFNLALWDKKRGHFWSGANVKTGAINKHELYLDNQSWSLLALDDEDLEQIDARGALKFNCQNFFEQDKQVKGFKDFRPTNRRPAESFVWSEGTLGHVLAMKRVKEAPTCASAGPKEFLVSMEKMKQEDGTIAYATQESKNFSSSGSVAGTAWLYFAKNNLNPFRP